MAQDRKQHLVLAFSDFSSHPSAKIPKFSQATDSRTLSTRDREGLVWRTPFVQPGVPGTSKRSSLEIYPAAQDCHYKRFPSKSPSSLRRFLNGLNRNMLNHFVLIDICSVDILVVRLRIGTDFKGDSFRDASMRALWSYKHFCSHNVSQIFKGIQALL